MGGLYRSIRFQVMNRGEAVTTDKHPMQNVVESFDEGIGQQGDLKAVAHQFTKAMISGMNGPDAQCRIAHP